MIKLYAKRVLSPFIGLLQVAEIDRARALSLDGKTWAIQYRLPNAGRRRAGRSATGSKANYSLVATLDHGALTTHAVHPFLESADVRSAIDRLSEAVAVARLPFAAGDRYEYWLLDGADGSPLALLHSCVQRTDIELVPPTPVWVAMPASQLDVPAPEPDGDTYVPPVNYRLQILVALRAGPKPRAAWFERDASTDDAFPPCLIREDWQNGERRQLCERYLLRLAPRLLMLQEMPGAVRRRLERAARQHVFEVERFYPLYPEVVDQALLTAARVEARIRRAAE